MFSHKFYTFLRQFRWFPDEAGIIMTNKKKICFLRGKGRGKWTPDAPGEAALHPAIPI
jgi:hypothetical protein